MFYASTKEILEQAIQKKYGDEAIQNPKKHWNREKEEDYLNQIKEFRPINYKN